MKIYRGISCKMFSIIFEEEIIHPKSHNFGIVFSHDGSIKYDGSATYGKTEENAILGHQIDSSKFKTSGISTTPHIERAKYYALHGYERRKGYILEFETEKIDKNYYQLITVSKRVKSPSLPEDSEIILKHINNKSIPLDLVTNIIEINEGKMLQS